MVAYTGGGASRLRDTDLSDRPQYTELFRLLDEGWRLPKNPPFPVSPSNIKAELRIIRHLMREQMEQRL